MAPAVAAKSRAWFPGVGLLGAVVLAACARPAPTYTEPFTGMRFVLLPAGEFTMGSPPGEPGRQDDEVAHRVVLSRPFYLAATEVTQGEWTKVMGSNPSRFRELGPQAPVERVSWVEVHEFLRRLNGRLDTRGEGRFRLPTEAEWEYACRAGATTAYASGDRLSTDDANYDGRYPLPDQAVGADRGTTAQVGSFRPNRWGLYDLSGNVWEWCEDDYCPYPAHEVRDPLDRCGSGLEVIRGGSWVFGADSARCALRYTHAPQLRGYSLGFRVARDAE
jgi:formylglycine-generating enzyme required for sulfatase activity